MAIGVVTDFGITEVVISGVVPSHSAMTTPLIIAIILPIKHTAMIDFQRARIWWNCSYSGKASATTAGCSKSLRILLP